MTAAIISNFEIWPLFIVSLLESCKRQRGGHAPGNRCSLALRSKAHLATVTVYVPTEIQLVVNKPVELLDPDHSHYNHASFDRYSCAADHCPAGRNNFHGDLSGGCDGNVESAGCASSYAYRKSVRQVAGFTAVMFCVPAVTFVNV